MNAFIVGEEQNFVRVQHGHMDADYFQRIRSARARFYAKQPAEYVHKTPRRPDRSARQNPAEPGRGVGDGEGRVSDGADQFSN